MERLWPNRGTEVTMYFEGTSKGKKIEVEIFEHPTEWLITLNDGELKETHAVKKWDYQRMDDAISFLFENTSYMINVHGEGVKYNVYTRGSYREIPLHNDESLLHESLKGGGGLTGGDSLSSGMPGKIVDILVAEGDEVKADQPVLIMEAMKMENEMRASRDCVIKEIKVEKGQSVESGSVLIVYGDK